MILLSPLFVIIILQLKLFTKGNIFFIHPRIGINGKVFNLYKFRTMKHSKDLILDNYFKNNPLEQVQWNKNYKLKNDPRITRIGYLLREFSIDELPQLINIVKGEMSFVGPRPIIDKEIDKYGNSFLKYKTVKPGLTGLWQTSGRNNTTYKQRINFDMHYIGNQSLLLDIRILLKTIPVVIFRKGAY